MPNDVLYPLLIGLACVVLVALVHRLTRPRPSRHDIAMPEPSGRRRQRRPLRNRPSAQVVNRSPHLVEPTPTPRTLRAWHIDHEAAVLDLIDHTDDVVRRADDSTTLPPRDFELEVRLADALKAHPAAEMRAELGAFRAAATAMAEAVERDDSPAIDRHVEIYLQYRGTWLDRMWQYPVDREHVARARNRAV